MLAARLSWVGPSFLSTIRQETPCRFSSAAMNRPAGPAPTTNTLVSVATRYPLVPAVVPIQHNRDDSQRAVLDIRASVPSGPPTLPDMRPIVWCVDTPAGRVVIGGVAEAQPKRGEAGRPTG